MTIKLTRLQVNKILEILGEKYEEYAEIFWLSLKHNIELQAEEQSNISGIDRKLPYLSVGIESNDESTQLISGDGQALGTIAQYPHEDYALQICHCCNNYDKVTELLGETFDYICSKNDNQELINKIGKVRALNMI